MKFFKWKTFIITAAVCLFPILIGVALWERLPEIMAIHFNIYGEPDNFASKGFVVFCLPLLMVALQAFCCIVSDWQSYKKGENKKYDTVTKWSIPCLAVALYLLTLCIGLGWNVDIRKAVLIILGVMFLVIGSCLPGLDRVKNYNIDAEKARKINGFVGVGTIIMGGLFIVSSFLPPLYSAICLALLIPFVFASLIYALIVIRKK